MKLMQKVVDNMNVSIVIPNYNGEKYLKVCLDSLSRQTFSLFEIIVVDNASVDNSCRLIEKDYPNVKLIKMKENTGFSKAVNVGIKTSNEKYVVLLNNDTEVDEGWLENLVKCIEEDEGVFSCCSKMLCYSDKNIIDDAGDEYTILGWAYKRGEGLPSTNYTKSEYVFSSCGGAAIYRKSIFDEIGYFDERFFAYMEDVDISYRARMNGYKNKYCASALVYHIGSATSGSRHNSFKVKLAARNNIYMIYKNMPLIQLILLLPFIILGCTIKYIFFCKIGFGKDYKYGIKDGILGLKYIKKISFKRKNFANYLEVVLNITLSTFNMVVLKLSGIKCTIFDGDIT